MTEWISRFEIDDNETDQPPRSFSSPYMSGVKQLDLNLPTHIGPRDFPTPTEAFETTAMAVTPAPDLIVRVNKSAWESTVQDSESKGFEVTKLREEILALEARLKSHHHEHEDTRTRLGQLKYENEINRNQKSAMGRTLSQKDVEIKFLQLENDDLVRKLANAEAEVTKLGHLKGIYLVLFIIPYH